MISRSRRRPWWPFVLVAAMLALGALALWQAPLENALWRVLAPALVLKERWFGGEQAMLRGQLEATQALVADRELLRAENAELKTRLGRPPKEG